MHLALNKEIQVVAANDIEQKHSFVNGMKTAEIKIYKKVIIKESIKHTFNPVDSYTYVYKYKYLGQKNPNTSSESLNNAPKCTENI